MTLADGDQYYVKTEVKTRNTNKEGIVAWRVKNSNVGDTLPSVAHISEQKLQKSLGACWSQISRKQKKLLVSGSLKFFAIASFDVQYPHDECCGVAAEGQWCLH